MSVEFLFSDTGHAGEAPARLRPLLRAADDLRDAVEPVRSCAVTWRGPEAYEVSTIIFPAVARQAHAVIRYLEAVDAGGHLGLFENGEPVYLDDAIAGFEAIGAADNAKILRAARERHVSGGWRSVRGALALHEPVELAWAALDLAVSRTDPLGGLRSLVRRHRDAF